MKKKFLFSKILFKTTLITGVLFLGITQVCARNWVRDQVNVPNWGGGVRSNVYSTKYEESEWAGFWGDTLPNKFGYTVELVNSAGDSRSDLVRLKEKETTWARGNTGTVNYYYYAKVYSRSYEPHRSRIDFQFTSYD